MNRDPRFGFLMGMTSAGPHSRRTAYLAVALAMLCAYPLLPDHLRRLDLLLASCGCVPAVATVLRRAAARDRRPWWLLSAALVASIVGNLAAVWATVVPPAATVAVAVAVAAGCTTVSTALVVGAAVAVVTRSGRANFGALIDSMIVSMAAGGLLWSTAVLPRLEATHQGPVAQLSTFVTIFGLGGVAGAMAWLLRTATGSVRTLWLLVVALTLPLAAQTIAVLRTGPTTIVAAMLWMVAYTALGLFGREPAALRVLRHGAVVPDTLTVGRLVLRGAALATVPVVLGVQRLSGNLVGGLTLAVVGTVIAVLVTVRSGRSAVEHARTEMALRHRATHDPLTGLPNRAEFMARLTAELLGPHRCMVLFCDLDGFKMVNDRLGHAAGDRLLVEVGQRLVRCVRENDMVARFGGDEFVILYRAVDAADPDLLCERIMAAVECPLVLDGVQVEIGTSIGAVVGTGRAGDAETAESRARHLIHQADQGMYAAKKRRARQRHDDRRDDTPALKSCWRNTTSDGPVNAASRNCVEKWLPTDLDARMPFPTY
jgi:diguanylate cyclase (GGDEF)-like protein